MGWLSRRSAGARSLEDAAADRLERLARQWRPVTAGTRSSLPDPEPSSHDPWQDVLTPEQESRRLRAGPWTSPAVRALLCLIAACLAVTAWWWWSGRLQEVTSAPVVLAIGQPLATSAGGPPIESGADPSPLRDVVVHVTGQVARPGLVTLPAGARVADAITAAGGVTRKRATDTVNLARVVIDGEQIVVGGTALATGPTPTSASLVILDLNAADSAAFEGLPGVGPVLAARILEWRVANGPFRTVDELGEVSGIGDATLARLRSLVRV